MSLNFKSKTEETRKDLNCLKLTKRIDAEALRLPEWQMFKEEYAANVDQSGAERAVLSALNSAVYQRRIVFAVTRAGLQKLIREDRNWPTRKGFKTIHYRRVLKGLFQFCDEIKVPAEDNPAGLLVLAVKDKELLKFVKVDIEQQLAEMLEFLKEGGGQDSQGNQEGNRKGNQEGNTVVSREETDGRNEENVGTEESLHTNHQTPRGEGITVSPAGVEAEQKARLTAAPGVSEECSAAEELDLTTASSEFITKKLKWKAQSDEINQSLADCHTEQRLILRELQELIEHEKGVFNDKDVYYVNEFYRFIAQQGPKGKGTRLTLMPKQWKVLEKIIYKNITAIKVARERKNENFQALIGNALKPLPSCEEYDGLSTEEKFDDDPYDGLSPSERDGYERDPAA